MAKTNKVASKSGNKKKKAGKDKKLSPEEKEAKAKAKAEAKAAKAAEKEAKKAEKAAAKERKRLEKEEKKRKKDEAKRRKAELKARKKAIKQLRKEQKTARKANASLQKEREAEEEELQERATPLGRRLARAATGGWVPNLRHWLDAGADPNARDETGATALMLAARWGHLEAVQLLLAAGADVDRRSELRHGGHTALYAATAANEVGIVCALLEGGADPDVVSDAGDTALHFACRAGYAQCARALLDSGADPDIANASGDTPFHTTVKTGRLELAWLLLSLGVVDCADARGEFVRDIAIRISVERAARAGSAMTPAEQIAENNSQLVPGAQELLADALRDAGAVAPVSDRYSLMDKNVRLLGARALVKLGKDHRGHASYADTLTVLDVPAIKARGSRGGCARCGCLCTPSAARHYVRFNIDVDRGPAQRKCCCNGQITGAPHMKKYFRRIHLRSLGDQVPRKPGACVCGPRPFVPIDRISADIPPEVQAAAKARADAGEDDVALISVSQNTALKAAGALRLADWATEPHPEVEWVDATEEDEGGTKKKKRGKGKGKKKKGKKKI